MEDAPADAESKRAFKFPFIACEIFTCTSSSGAENTAVIAAGLALISIAAASAILLQVDKKAPQASEYRAEGDASASPEVQVDLKVEGESSSVENVP
ncbi:uncharacterized protein A4U43_C04F17600 [Asparagus officinalis]|uniref:Uncharacterized protein n=1 Tax=Asparagus officinalis TaxID=4686 RepID=A0A5P1F6G6_ASPOF|nr:uncharacterized protein A4U43_C04F17510 [Asparagus officinalis]ONK72270.1 uncharacterized protein A4U43_C04F17600 [Asparagus officinalis]